MLVFIQMFVALLLVQNVPPYIYAYMIYDTFFKAQANGSFCQNTCRLISLCLL